MIVYESRLNSVTGLFSLVRGLIFVPKTGGWGGGGFSEKCGVSKLPPPQKKKIIYENCTAPLAKTIFKMHTLQPLLDQVCVFILGH